jgi:hypothetical protein
MESKLKTPIYIMCKEFSENQLEKNKHKSRIKNIFATLNIIQ